MIHGLTFYNIHFLWGLLILPILVFYYIRKHSKQKPSLTLSSTTLFESIRLKGRTKYIHIPFILRILAIATLIIAMARPQTSLSRQDVSVEGIDIVMALDISYSMLSIDLKPNRLEAAKDVAMEFIKNRPNDRIGLVVYRGETFTQCPITSDHSVLQNIFGNVKNGNVDDGTAIGDGLATAINRIKASKAVSKVIILLTDGNNNRGSMDPLTAAEIAKIYGIRVYTIGVGTYGAALCPVKDQFGNVQYQKLDAQIDEMLLKSISKTTGAAFYRATSKEKLADIYSEIDKMEKSKIDVMEYRRKKEEFFPLLILAALLLILELGLRFTYLKSLP